MYKDLIFKLISMPFTRDALNCIVRYLMAQPVEVDFMVVFLLIAEYTGLSGLCTRLFENQDEENVAEDLLQAS